MSGVRYWRGEVAKAEHFAKMTPPNEPDTIPRRIAQEALYRYVLFDVWSPRSQRLRVACASALRSLAI